MVERVRGRLTYANVMATIAVFLTLGGGVAWALARNSVKSKHIAPDQVKGADVNESKLGVVPRASTAENADQVDGADGCRGAISLSPADGERTLCEEGPVKFTAECIDAQPTHAATSARIRAYTSEDGALSTMGGAGLSPLNTAQSPDFVGRTDFSADGVPEASGPATFVLTHPSGAQLVMQIALVANEGAPDICHFPAGGFG